jgi:hypothetical protein
MEREGTSMRKFILTALGLYVLGAIWKFEKDEDGTFIALSPFVAAIGLLLLTRRAEEALNGRRTTEP